MKRFTITALALVLTLALQAIPAKRNVCKTGHLSDGTELKVELVGDELGHYWQSADGRKFMLQDETGLLTPVDETAMQRHISQRRAAVNTYRQQRVQQRQTESTLPTNQLTGKKNVLLILVNYQDVKFQDGHGKEAYEQILNQPNFSNDQGFVGSVYDYYKAQSKGQFEVHFDIKGPVTLSQNMKYYGGNDAYGNDKRPYEMLKEACDSVASEVNFADYDWNGDREVDQVFLIYAGQGEAVSGVPDQVWPHEWSLVASTGRMYLVNGYKINTYACSPEMYSKTRQDGIGTICHEFGHCLGLMDMYDTGYRYAGMGTWDVMAQGSYNGDSNRPPFFSTVERMICGWGQPVELVDDQTVDHLEPYAQDGTSYIIYNDANRDEFYTIENRQRMDWDTELPGTGLLITHVDYNESQWSSNSVNTSKNQGCSIIPANNRSIFYTRATYDYDAYPYMDNDSLTNNSRPAAKLNTPNTDGKYYMNKALYDMAVNADGTASFRFVNNNVSTGIAGVKVNAEALRPQRIYDLCGRYVGSSFEALTPGVYIVNGQKRIKKQ